MFRTLPMVAPDAFAQSTVFLLKAATRPEAMELGVERETTPLKPNCGA
jgi:hypothetical protein